MPGHGPCGRSCWEHGFKPLLGSPPKGPGPSQSWGAEGNGAWEWRVGNQGNRSESHESEADLGGTQTVHIGGSGEDPPCSLVILRCSFNLSSSWGQTANIGVHLRHLGVIEGCQGTVPALPLSGKPLPVSLLYKIRSCMRSAIPSKRFPQRWGPPPPPPKILV